MDCTKFHELVSAYVDGETSGVQAEALEKHLETCSDCKSYLANQLRLKDMIKESYSAVSEIDLSASIMNKIGAPAEVQKKPSRMKKLSLVAAAVAAVCVITMAAFMSLQTKSNTVAGNQKLEEYVLEHVGTNNSVDLNGKIEAVNLER